MNTSDYLVSQSRKNGKNNGCGNSSRNEMKKLIRKVAEQSGSEYQVWAEIYPVQGPGNLFALKFSSVWTGARDPEAAQNKGNFFFERDDLDRLQVLIQEATQ